MKAKRLPSINENLDTQISLLEESVNSFSSKWKIFIEDKNYNSIDEMINCINGDEEAFVIGGGMVYRQMMERADKLYITHIHHSWPDADTFFPEIDPAIWKQLSAERHEADENNPYAFTFAEYTRQATH
jgi:dihydrofolate reductase